MARKIGKKERKKDRKPQPSSYFIGSEGTKTEVIYFKGFAEKLRTKYAGLDGKVVVPSFVIEGMGTSNARLLQDIEDYLRTDPRIFENVWAVFDKDDIPKDYFDNAINKAKSNGWNVAWTKDSFELWYLLHFEYLNSAIDRAQYKQKLKERFKKNGLSGYEKNDPGVFEILYDKKDTALKNASKLEGIYDNSVSYSERNPCTTVHDLVGELVNLENQAKDI